LLVERIMNKQSESLISEFVQSMQLSIDSFRDGEGYDLSVLQRADSDTLETIEQIVISHTPRDWRDIEFLSLLKTDRARHALWAAFQDPDPKVRLTVHRYAPELLTHDQRAESLIDALQVVEAFGGLTEAIDEITTFHPPVVIQAMLQGLMTRDGITAYHLADMLYFLHGKSTSLYDWEHRPLFLRFNTENTAEREPAFRELCKTIGADADNILRQLQP
jgi:hypothetical protein